MTKGREKGFAGRDRLEVPLTRETMEKVRALAAENQRSMGREVAILTERALRDATKKDGGQQ